MWVKSNPNAEESVWSPSIVAADIDQQRTFSFQASDSFAKCFQVDDCSKALDERHVQIRLLFELQAHFVHMNHAQGISPECHEAMLWCVLSFPAVCFTSSQKNEGGEMNAMNIGNGVAIPVGTQNQVDRRKIFVPFGPQSFDVDVRLDRMEEGEILVVVSLSREDRFSWVLWRDEFTSRLEAVRQLQESNDLECPQVLRSEAGISAGLRSAQVTACGIGEKICLWWGWLPHRTSICLFEVKSDGLILKMTENIRSLRCKEDLENVLAAGLVESRKIPVNYETADSLDLEYISAVAHKILGMLSSGADEEVELRFDGMDILDNEMKRVSNSRARRDQEFRLKLAESDVAHHRNVYLLEATLQFLDQRKISPDLFQQTANMVERLCSLVGEKRTDFAFGSPGMRMQDEKMRKTIFLFVKHLACRGFEGHAMCKSFARICTSIESYDRLENVQLVSKYLLKSIIKGSQRLSCEVLGALHRDLGSILGRIGFRRGPISFLLSITDFENRGLNWNRYGWDDLLGNGVPPSSTLAAKLLSIGSVEQNDMNCSHTLGLMHQVGFQNNGKNPVKAHGFYTHAADGGCVQPMVNLGLLLHEGTEGILPNPVRSVELYERAIEGGETLEDFFSMVLKAYWQTP